MLTRGEELLNQLVKRVDDFVFDHNVYPNAIIISHVDLGAIGDTDRVEIKEKLPTITSLIPTSDPFAFDLPLPVLLPVVATKHQRKRVVILENKPL